MNDEPPRPGTEPLLRVVRGEPDSAEDAVTRGRARRPLGSLPTLTGIFGLYAAHTAIQMLLADTQDQAGPRDSR